MKKAKIFGQNRSPIHVLAKSQISLPTSHKSSSKSICSIEIGGERLFGRIGPKCGRLGQQQQPKAPPPQIGGGGGHADFAGRNWANFSEAGYFTINFVVYNLDNKMLGKIKFKNIFKNKKNIFKDLKIRKKNIKSKI